MLLGFVAKTLTEILFTESNMTFGTTMKLQKYKSCNTHNISQVEFQYEKKLNVKHTSGCLSAVSPAVCALFFQFMLIVGPQLKNFINCAGDINTNCTVTI